MQRVLPFFLLFLATQAYSQQKNKSNSTIDTHKEKSLIQAVIKDSTIVVANAKYGKASGFKKSFLGENYRREWAAETTLPLLQLSRLYGGLTLLNRAEGCNPFRSG
ncbi:hypothetical protein KUH03_19660 [Sphingobacterium sp. E70]|uniref:hypothetical protein n=1 Tax=Sphingobacterium sp. E70 TaxID=2853439 RepID=UPI00211C6CF1|nr:hypothetical protein [Sphingobacterium sp. E70]ULT28544.1 hypothetical protein KUH03_19660 [Sphingobacterium sp. E70]